MYDVVVCCKPYGGPGAVCHFPNVRGFYLAKYLALTRPEGYLLHLSLLELDFSSVDLFGL